MFLVSLYIALVIFAVGVIYKISTWFRYKLDPAAGDITPTKRIAAAAKGIGLTVLSAKALTLLKVFIVDVLLQIRVLRENFLRWLMHMLIFWGFMLLVFMHALDSFTSERLFADYYSTVNPFMFLRDFFGFMVIAGIAIAVFRRFVLKAPRLATNVMDHYALAILAVILISGVFLEGLQITSHTEFMWMQQDYAGLEDEAEIRALESYWVQNYGLVSPSVTAPFEDNILTQGEELHAEICAGCHSRPQAAFTGYAASKLIQPLALALDQAGGVIILWYIHFLACFAGLAYLPFSKMFHIFSSPLSLMANAVMDHERSDPANIATRQIMELDACTHCGTCSLRCAVGVAFEELSNINILPSEKLASIKALAAGRRLGDRELKILLEGLYLCTNCQRCTVVCPVGINLQELWFTVRESLLQRGYPEVLMLSPLSLYRGLTSDRVSQDRYRKPLQRVKQAITEEFQLTDIRNNTLTDVHMSPGLKHKLGLSLQSNTFSYCFNCKTCTLSCPVVKNFDDPRGNLGLEPHHIIHATMLGLGDLIFSSKMLWTCLGCYQCQENCPQEVRVTDVFYELKNLAVQEFRNNAPIS
jgi:heterodisulfide reductase subunit C/nitrate reductase gamma subunit